jgi:hypothetical protein
VPKLVYEGMKIRFGLLILALVAGAVTADAQRSRRHNVVVKTPSIVESYVDSLAHIRERIDSTEMSSDDSRYAMLLFPSQACTFLLNSDP